MNQLGHVLLPVTGVTTLDVTDELLCSPSASGVGELEWPETGSGLLEVGSTGGDLVNKVLDTWVVSKEGSFEKCDL